MGIKEEIKLMGDDHLLTRLIDRIAELESTVGILGADLMEMKKGNREDAERNARVVAGVVKELLTEG